MDSKTNLPSLPKRVSKGNSVIDEINRGKEYSKLIDERQFAVPINSIVSGHTEKSDGKIKVETKSDRVKQDDKGKPGQITVQTKPDPVAIDQNIKVDTKPVELYQQLYPDIYVERTIVPEYQPNYEDIPHANRNIINRDALSTKQHMNLLAQPKLVKQRQVEPPFVVRRKVPGPSPRIIQLARPKRRQTLVTCNQFGATMDKFCIENCHRNVQDVTFVPVHDAVYFIELNKRRPLIEKAKLKLRMKRLQEKITEAKMAKTQDVLRNLYASLKGYLLPPPSIRKERAECADCAKGSSPCAKCTKVESGSIDDTSDDSDMDDMDDETRKLSLVLRCKMEKLLNRKDEIKQGSHWDLLLVWISGKLAVWMKKLQNSEEIESKPKVTTGQN